MKHVPGRLFRAAALLALTALPAFSEASLRVGDATGREVLVPVEAQRVFAAGPPAAVLLYVLKPAAMVGWVAAPKPADLPFLKPEAAALPVLGRLTGKGDTLNLEVLLASGAELIIDYGTVNDTYRDLAERVQDQAGLPYLLIDGRFERMPDGLRQLGSALGVSERAEALALYAEAAFAEADALLAELPEEGRPRVYLARGPEGLESPARGSINAEIIERMGAINVVEAETRGLVTASPEQIQAWAPDVIITMDAGFAAAVKDLPEWQGIPAVEKGRVWLAPSKPFGFIDGPPSVNRLIGLKWLAHKLYPELAKGDLRQDVADFYTLFYGVTPDAAALDQILAP